MTYRKAALLALMLLLLATGACRQNATESGEATVSTAVPPTLPPPVASTATPVPPTPTPTAPLAALVNGQPIYLADYERELARYEATQAALGDDAAAGVDYRAQVLDALIERELIRQAATADGISVTAQQVDARLAELRASADASGGFDAWLQANGYTEEEFRAALEAELVTGEVVARVTAAVPETMEQVRASYIQLDDAALAQNVLDRARAGDDFAFLAEQNSVDRVTGVNGGDLGFFAPGGLLVPEVEQAAFALQPGEISDVIAVANADGRTIYYIIRVTEREPDRPLTADARYALLQETFSGWLEGLWSAAAIERLVP